MKTIVLSACALLLANALFAQNWSPINTEETFYYNSGGEELTGIRVDSVSVVEGATVWYPIRMADLSPEIELLEWDCPSTAITNGIIRAGFLQGEIVLTENGGFLFQHPDSFMIIPSVGLGEGWIFSVLYGEDPVTAEVVDIGEMEVLGVIDSVKTIGLSDGRTIHLSKNHGLLSFESTDGLNYSLSGIPDRQLGNYPIGRFEVFDFEVGDVFVYIENWSGTSSEYHLILQRIEIINISEIGNGNYEYTYNIAIYKRTWQLMEIWPGVNELEEIAPTSGQGVTSSEIYITDPHSCDAVPGTFFSLQEQMNDLVWPPILFWQNEWFGYHKNVYMDTINNRKSKVIGGSSAFAPFLISIAENFAESQNSGSIDEIAVAFQQFDIFGSGLSSASEIGDTTVLSFSTPSCADITSSMAFAEGLGLVSSEFYAGLNFSMIAMVGYRKGTEEFGYVPTAAEVLAVGINEVSTLPKVTVYPVPPVDELFLSPHDAQTYRIFDISGKPVLQGSLLGASVIDVSNLAAGMYNGHLLRDDQPTGQFRFVKMK